MTIRTLKNNKGKVVGLSINGKKFTLGRDICHNLSLEERKSQADSQTAIDKIKTARKELSNKKYIGTSPELQIEVQFTEGKEVISSKSKVEFASKYNETDQETKNDYVRLLEQFVLCLNNATKAHNRDIEDRLKGAIKSAA